MKLFKLGLRFWIGLTSIFSFLGGWVMLAHSPKPFQPSTSAAVPSTLATPLPTLAPLAPMQNFTINNNSGFQNVPVIVQPTIPPSNFFSQQPIFTTGGS